MRFDYFEGLSAQEAARYLADFQAHGRRMLDTLRAEAAEAGVALDMTLDALPAVFEWVRSRIDARVVDEASTPDWIRKAGEHYAKRVEYTPASNDLLLFMAYYFGACFVQEHDALSWGTGEPKTAEFNSPVVKGFKFGMELSPILIVENLMDRTFIDYGQGSGIAGTVSTWQNMAG